MKRLFVNALLTLTFAATSQLISQTQEHLTGSVHHVFVVPAQEKVDVTLKGMANGTRWYVAVVATQTANVRADVLSLGLSVEGNGMKHLASVQPVSQSSITTGPGSLLIDASHSTPAIYMEVPAGTYVEVHNGSASIGGRVTNDLVMRSGSIDTDAHVTNFPSFFAFLHSPDLAIPDITRRPNGEYAVSATFAKKHIRNNPRPTVSTGTNNGTLLVKMSIDTTGSVTSVTQVRGDTGLFQRVSTTLSAWSFSPFSEPTSSTVVPVTLVFPITAADGSAHSPFF